MLEQVEWGKFRLWDLFDKIKVISLKYKTSELPSTPKWEFNLPALTAWIQNQWLNNYVPRWWATILKNVISISANWANTWATFFQKKEFTVLQDAYAVQRIYNDHKLTDNHYLFLVNAISKSIYWTYERTNKAWWERIKSDSIQLPVKNWKIDFEFMDKFIAELEAKHQAELEAYLETTWLKNYELNNNELTALKELEEWKIEWKNFNLEDLFWKSTRWKRLKSDDRIPWSLPFVTAWEAEEWISAFIWNDVTVFSKNTTTIDMFWSAKYRNYEYWWDDHVAVVHTEKLEKYAAIFVTTAIHKSSHNWQFDYWKNFYAKDADELYIQLPIKNNEVDYDFMKTLISAVHKLIIKDVVLYADREIKATKEVINK